MNRRIVPREERQARETGSKYNFKFWHELGWGILVAIIVTVAQALIQFDATTITDWEVWAISIISGCARAAAVIVIKTFTEDIVFSKE